MQSPCYARPVGSEDLLQSRVPSAGNIVYVKFAKRVDLMRSFVITVTIIMKSAAGNCGRQWVCL